MGPQKQTAAEVQTLCYEARTMHVGEVGAFGTSVFEQPCLCVARVCEARVFEVYEWD